MNIYQKEHCIENNHFVVEHKSNFSFPSHLHRCFEFIIILDGEMNVSVDGNSLCLHQNECALIFPNQIHSLESTHSEHILFIFSPETIAYFNTKVEGLFASTNFFQIDDVNLLNQIKSASESENSFTVKGLLYLICGVFYNNVKFVRGRAKSDGQIDLLKSILQYVEENHKGHCTLETLAEHLSYDYSYISRLFQKKTGMSFNTYLNQLRLNSACFMLTESDESILDISIACGYESPRSFNRNFLKFKGMTPKDYRLNFKNPS